MQSTAVTVEKIPLELRNILLESGFEKLLSSIIRHRSVIKRYKHLNKIFTELDEQIKKFLFIERPASESLEELNTLAKLMADNYASINSEILRAFNNKEILFLDKIELLSILKIMSEFIEYCKRTTHSSISVDDILYLENKKDLTGDFTVINDQIRYLREKNSDSFLIEQLSLISNDQHILKQKYLLALLLNKILSHYQSSIDFSNADNMSRIDQGFCCLTCITSISFNDFQAQGVTYSIKPVLSLLLSDLSQRLFTKSFKNDINKNFPDDSKDTITYMLDKKRLDLLKDLANKEAVYRHELHDAIRFYNYTTDSIETLLFRLIAANYLSSKIKSGHALDSTKIQIEMKEIFGQNHMLKMCKTRGRGPSHIDKIIDQLNFPAINYMKQSSAAGIFAGNSISPPRVNELDAGIKDVSPGVF